MQVNAPKPVQQVTQVTHQVPQSTTVVTQAPQKVVVPSNYQIQITTEIPTYIPQVLPVGVTVFEYPTRWQIKQKFFSLGGDLKVKDCYGNHIFTFKGKVITLTNKMNILDARSGGLVGSFNQQIKLGMPHFKVKIMGKYYATMKMRFTLGKPKFKIELANGELIQIKGDWIGYDFTFRRGARVIAVVSKAFFSYTDSYGVEVLPGEDVVLILCAVAIIDKCLHEGNSGGFDF
jgi:uncharacterized protein YxjI